jgi:hypothetical protein
MSERKRIGLREVRTLRPSKMIWDTAVVGFAAWRQKSETVTYLVKYRTITDRQRWHVIGHHGSPWTPECARAEARRVLGEVVTGADPPAETRAVRKATTVAELCDSYFADAGAGRMLTRSKTPKKASTLAIDKGRIERDIKPLLGGFPVAAVSAMTSSSSCTTWPRAEPPARRRRQKAWPGACHRRSNGRNARGRTPRRHLHLCRAAAHARRQSRAWRRTLRRLRARSAPLR